MTNQEAAEILQKYIDTYHHQLSDEGWKQMVIMGIMYKDLESETELRLLFLGDIKLTVSRVAFKNRRCGTMTEVMSFLEQFCINNEIQKIVIQSVETEEMVCFCLKNNMIPNQYCLEMEVCYLVITRKQFKEANTSFLFRKIIHTKPIKEKESRHD